jgi:23S rRNA pseudouridine955/2504/2580 synthase
MRAFRLCGDDKYGDFALNKQLEKAGLKRMFLHAAKLAFPIR